jgi:CheY-like chemotaxis protein
MSAERSTVDRPIIVVAHESETIREAVSHLLAEAGYRVRSAGAAASALAALDGAAALVLDVALPGMHAYDLVEQAKRRQPPPCIVLVASIYNRTGYKRRPTSLYGADDYVEQHHIADALVAKLERLIGEAPRHVEPPPPDVETEDGRRIRDAGVSRLSLVRARPDAPAKAVERAERLARLIVADIALYNGDALDAADQHGHTDELEARLRMDLEEGRLLFDLRVPEEVRRTRDFIGEALTELRHNRRAGVGQ